jgi:hypothetical protein
MDDWKWSVLFPNTRTDLPFGLTTISEQGYGQLFIFDSAEGATKQLYSQPISGYVAEVMQRLDESMRQINPFVE